jgi:tRNA A-37 threonylcarbamoyl transferase component Bud32
MLYQVNFNTTIKRNIQKAFSLIHARGVCHGDVRVENILVKLDNSVVIIDFETSVAQASRDRLSAEMKEVKELLASLERSSRTSDR